MLLFHKIVFNGSLPSTFIAALARTTDIRLLAMFIIFPSPQDLRAPFISSYKKAVATVVELPWSQIVVSPNSTLFMESTKIDSPKGLLA